MTANIPTRVNSRGVPRLCSCVTLLSAASLRGVLVVAVTGSRWLAKSPVRAGGQPLPRPESRAGTRPLSC